MDALKIYAGAFKKNIRYYYPVEDVFSPVEIGDFGTLKGNFFIKKGNISEIPFNVGFKIKEEKLCSNKNFGIDCNVDFSAKGEAKFNRIPDASMRIKFTKKHSVYYNTTYTSVNEMQNIIAVEDVISRLFNEGIWKKEYLIVSAVVKSKNTIIVVSGDNSAEVVLSCKEKKNITLSDAEIEYQIVKQPATSYVFATQDDREVTPMFQLMKIYGESFTPAKRLIPMKTGADTFDSKDKSDLELYRPDTAFRLNIVP